MSTLKAKKTRLHWSPEEERNLAQVWIDASEDGNVGDDQSGTIFKKRVYKKWCERTGKTYRTVGQLYSKWRKCNKAAMIFNRIYMQTLRSRGSGTNIEDAIAISNKIFKEKYESKSFKNWEYWKVVKDNPKWKALRSVYNMTGLIKMPKISDATYNQSSDVRYVIDLDKEEDMFKAPPRPIASDATKAAKRKFTSVSTFTDNVLGATVDLSKSDTSLEKLAEVERREKLVEVERREKLVEVERLKEENRANRVRLKLAREQRRVAKDKTRALSLLMKDTSHMSEEERKIVENAKADIAKTYKWSN